MRFFSRIVLVCNVCFIIAVIMWFIESSRRLHGNYDGVIKFQPLESTLVILGYGAILINAVFVFLALYLLATKKIKLIPRWIVLFNLLIFPIQVYYHFFLH
jgi:hypothetical protein